MESRLRPGIGWFLKIKSRGKSLRIAAVLIAWSIATIACSQGYVSTYDLTATALFANNGGAGGGDTLPAADTPTPADPANTPDPAAAATTQAAEDNPPTLIIASPVPTSPNATPRPPILYYTQAGDALPAVSVRFGVNQDEIASNETLDVTGFLPAGKLLIIPDRVEGAGPVDAVMPDSEIVFSPSALGFDTAAFAENAGGYLASYREYLADGWKTGAEVVNKVAIENSINPRMLLGLIEFQAGWVYGQPANLALTDYPMGFINKDKKGLYKQLSWAVQQLSIGYYGWREGLYTNIGFNNNTSLRLAPSINAGTAAIEFLFSRLYHPDEWNGVMFGSKSFAALYDRMFDNPWVRAQTVEPLLPVNLTQPDLQLPFLEGRIWSFTGGPHSAWGPDGARAALDFAPSATEPGCVKSDDWATASATGLVVRSGNGVVVLDLDGDGYEQTGWVLAYLHIRSDGRVPVGTWVEQGGIIGHPSCEGGVSTGTHIQIARKYNGEWVLAGGPLPFNLDGWVAQAGARAYQGAMKKGSDTIEACTCGSYETRISRPTSGN